MQVFCLVGARIFQSKAITVSQNAGVRHRERVRLGVFVSNADRKLL